MVLAARKWTALLFCLLVGVGLALLGPRARADAPTVAVAEAHRDFVDSRRTNWRGTGPRPLKTVVWYPSAPTPADAAEPAVSSHMPRYSLILISHGSGGDAQSMAWLGRYLAAHGYIAAAVNHIGGSGDEIVLAGQFPITEWQMWERARDLSVVLDKLLADPVFGPRIDRDRIGAAGFSLGGYTAIALGGARLNLERLAAKSPSPPPGLLPSLPKAIAEDKELRIANPIVRASAARSGDSYEDRRVRAIFALAPAIGCGFEPSGLAPVHVPVRIVVGHDDQITPPVDNAEYYARLIHGAALTVLPGEAGHFIKVQDPAQQAQILDQVSAIAVAFFAQTLVR